MVNTIQQTKELEGEILVDKPQLMEYLKAVCDGEAALYACNETTDALRRQLNAIPEKLPKPDRPELHYQKPKKKEVDLQHGVKGWLIKIVAAIVSVPVAFLVAGISGVGGLGISSGVATFFAIVHFVKKKADSANERAYQQECNAAADAAQPQFISEMQKYNQEIEAIKLKEKANKIIREELCTVITENEQTGERIRNELKKLYDRNIIHEPFRSMIAVNQIYEYLYVGVCNALEGADGAYAMYYNDIRTARICGGIQELKCAMQRGLSKLMASQNTMCQLLSDTNNSIRQMDTSLQTKISALQSDVGRVSDGVSSLRGSVLDSTDAANRQREEIRGILSTVAHNQYVEQREKGMSTWLLRNPY